MNEYLLILASFERVFAEWMTTTIPTVRIVDVFYSYCAIYFEHKANAYNKTAYGYYEDKTIKEKYSKYDSFYVLFSVRNWITDGYWNTTSFKRELTNKFGVENVSDSQRFLQHDLWELDENIIQNGLPMVLKEAYDGNLCFDDIISLLQRLRLLESYNVLLPIEVNYEKIEGGLDERLRKIRDGDELVVGTEAAPGLIQGTGAVVADTGTVGGVAVEGSPGQT